MSKHTPGPWHPVNYAGFWHIQDSPNYETETNILDEDVYANAEANAVLAAAAPELLEALRDMLKSYPFSDVNQTPIKIKAYNAINKATNPVTK